MQRIFQVEKKKNLFQHKFSKINIFHSLAIKLKFALEAKLYNSAVQPERRAVVTQRAIIHKIVIYNLFPQARETKARRARYYCIRQFH